MGRLVPIGWLRVCGLSLSEDETGSSPILDLGVNLATPTRDFGTQARRDEVYRSYRRRARTRPVPFGAFSAVMSLKLDSSGGSQSETIPLRPQKEWWVRTFLARAILERVYMREAADRFRSGDIHAVTVNPSLARKGRWYSWLGKATGGGRAASTKLYLAAEELVAFVEKGEARDAVGAFVDQLLEDQFLWPGLSASASDEMVDLLEGETNLHVSESDAIEAFEGRRFSVEDILDLSLKAVPNLVERFASVLTQSGRNVLPIHSGLFAPSPDLSAAVTGVPEDLEEIRSRAPRDSSYEYVRKVADFLMANHQGEWVRMMDLADIVLAVDDAQPVYRDPFVDGLGLEGGSPGTEAQAKFPPMPASVARFWESLPAHPSLGEEVGVDERVPLLVGTESGGRFRVLGSWYCRGDRRLFRIGDLGPVGTLAGRFLRGGELAPVRKCIQDYYSEVEKASGSIVADVSYIGDASISDVTQHARLTPYQIVLDGGHNGSKDRLTLADLAVGVVDGILSIWSIPHQKRVLPVFLSAANYHDDGPSWLRFLIEASPLMPRGIIKRPRLSSRPYWPRVVLQDRILLLPQTWTLPQKVLDAPAQSFLSELKSWRSEWGVPRWVRLGSVEHSSEAFDLGDAVDQAVLRQRLREMESPVVHETDWGDEISTVVQSSRGPHASEVVCYVDLDPLEGATPFSRQAAGVLKVDKMSPPRAHNLEDTTDARWCFVKVYAEQLVHDQILDKAWAPLLAQHPAAEDRLMHFLRYADPDEHLRLRIQCPSEDRPLVRAALQRSLGEAGLAGYVKRIAFEDYTPERNRYGGDSAMELAHTIFDADARCALKLFSMMGAGEVDDIRGLWAIRTVATLIKATADDLDERLAIATTLRAKWQKEFPVDDGNKALLDSRFRELKVELAALVAAVEGENHDYDDEEVREAFERLFESAARAWEGFQRLDRQGSLSTSLESIRGSLIHMACNRIFEGRAREAAVHYLHQRALDSYVARKRAMERGAKKKK